MAQYMSKKKQVKIYGEFKCVDCRKVYTKNSSNHVRCAECYIEHQKENAKLHNTIPFSGFKQTWRKKDGLCRQQVWRKAKKRIPLV